MLLQTQKYHIIKCSDVKTASWAFFSGSIYAVAKGSKIFKGGKWTSKRQTGTQMSVQSSGVVHCSQYVPETRSGLCYLLRSHISACTVGLKNWIPSRHHLCICKKFWKGICSCLLEQAGCCPSCCVRVVQLFRVANIISTQRNYT